ncbi:2-succinyl-5-enolpyruvyl-6-hydroxy-3-cyclohexene-1-carboxylic-acid synthase [Aquimarina sp. BL5]|uniref:2-succinyl-5-enolpyruvyl-6-hydroxy-3- cyclohexene-1-carboxylic-acid synthase n=1 Tax=Aquimarina sp. BL5 TaxID=1714860 RepID=UPI000E5430DF|nr:2-succinyl-5-enolpyruvyl-6-hydroxy-3-cyclohexene-1-carboxylic-acid synthase [Aquimarina sp. BL5]AXT49897.1 2-succinyl-5-enolpyruvyl-6-hydroxy-3-cyclohexene-1-carboxylic-acid synthase [Aquimarina sp. BL5]RKM97729.1 2-succinyl-5-enolpyruvyl-6-hydroxy-3-cyclohexene-1-carboxylic-acid synthase [Aquimarina sp. BL5]
MKKRLYSKIPLSQTVVALCEAKGIHHIVISPGSRNAPLTIGFTENPDMNCYSIVDERCAAFFALGIAQQIKKPVALVCTSGSALLNYYPAISEAFYSDIPLVVLSADRPIERIDIGDGQTIRQKNVFENHILYSANLYSEIVPETEINDLKIKQKQHEAQKHNEREINLALNASIENRGPVHINVPFYEPLYDTIEQPTISPKNIPVEYLEHRISDALRSSMLIEWNKAKRKIILIGVNAPNSIERRWIDHFAKDSSVLVLTETTSNIHHDTHVNCIDQLITSLNEEEFRALQPEILLTFGGMVVSKRIKAFFRNYQPKVHWHIDEKKAYDTYFCLTEHIKMNPNSFFSDFLPDTEALQNDYKSFWISLRNQRRVRHAEYLERIDFTDLKVFETLFNHIPDDQMIQLSNSSTVRYAQLFSLNPSFKVYCNRGTSGIDGSTSTAIGAAVASGVPTTLITGDLSFFYDSNGLWNDNIPANFKIILINNSGGGIFRILPGKSETDNFSTYFETKHKLTAQQLCSMFSVKYTQTNGIIGLLKGIENLYFNNDSPQLLEVFTPRKVNDSVLIDYFRHFI